MTERARNFLVGLFALSAMTVLAILMVWFGETPSWLQRSEWALHIVGVRDIRGIGDGSPVYLSGVEIGRVSSLEFEVDGHPASGVVVVTKIRNRYTVPRGSTGKIYSATLGFGTGEIHIIPPQEETSLLGKNAEGAIRGEMHSAFKDIISDEFTESVQRTIDRIGDFAHAAQPVAGHLSELLMRRTVNDVVQDPTVTPNLYTAVQRLDVLVANANQILGDPAVQQDVKTAINDLRTTSTDLKELVIMLQDQTRRTADNLNEGIDHIDADFRALSQNVIAVTDRLDSSADNLNKTMEKMASGHGTIGLLLNDARLYESAVLASQRLGDFLATLGRIASKIEDDGYITLAAPTAIGPLPKRFQIDPHKNRQQPE